MTATAAVPAPALIETVDGRRWWRCPACRQTLGEVTATLLIVKLRDRTIRVSLTDAIEQRCPRCGRESALLADQRRSC